MEDRGSIPGRGIQTGPEVHPASYPMGTGDSFPCGELQFVHVTTHLQLLSSTGMLELYLHSPMCLHGVMLDSLSTGTGFFFNFYLSFFI
jgi:hypothetical protein